MTEEQWFKEARRAAKHYWCYEELVDDAEEDLKRCFEAGDDPFDAVKAIGKDLDLTGYGPAWGDW